MIRQESASFQSKVSFRFNYTDINLTPVAGASEQSGWYSFVAAGELFDKTRAGIVTFDLGSAKHRHLRARNGRHGGQQGGRVEQ